MPQAREDAAHRRLAQIKALPRARDIAFGQQRVKRDQEIQIELAKVHRLAGDWNTLGHPAERCSRNVGARPTLAQPQMADRAQGSGSRGSLRSRPNPATNGRVVRGGEADSLAVDGLEDMSGFAVELSPYINEWNLE